MTVAKLLALIVSVALVHNSSVAALTASARLPQRPLPPAVFDPLREAIDKPYLDLFATAHRLEFSKPQLDRMREFQKQTKKDCADHYRQSSKALDQEVRRAQADLQRRSDKLSDPERKDLHCRIQNLRIELREARLLCDQAIPVAYENRLAKLDLIEYWPAQLEQIRSEIRSGAYTSRRFGDVKDIGFRDVGRGQEDDIKLGKESIEQMKREGFFPPELDNEVVREYVTTLAQKIASRSDLRVPLRVTLLNSQEINAFALPGGYLFVQRGLLEAVEDDAQLAGVLAHEISHVAARHGRRLMRKATFASILFEAAQVAAIIVTGGVAGIGTYYALQYGFYGLGMLLSLDLLGVSRDFEREADQLGIQYAWNAGYDPSGFVRFFDRMALREGYVRGLSWFRTHPPFYDRMVASQRELHYLPEKDEFVVRSTSFDRMKAELQKVTRRAADDEKHHPSLERKEKDCPPPKEIKYEPGKPVDTICPQT